MAKGKKKEVVEIIEVDKKQPKKSMRAAAPARPKKNRPKAMPKLPPTFTISGADANTILSRPKLGMPMTLKAKPDAHGSNTLAYTMSLLNPWDPQWNEAKVPAPSPIDSVVIRSKEFITGGCPTVDTSGGYTANMVFNGFGGLIMRPNALFRQYVVTQGAQFLGFAIGAVETTNGLVAWTPADNEQWLILNMIGNPASESVPGPQYDPAQSAWLAPQAASSIQEITSKFRAVSAGLVAKYIGPAVTQSGLIACGTVPYDNLEILQTDPDGSGVEDSFTGLSWQTFIDLKGVVVGPAGNGCNLTYVPKDDRATEWKQTTLTFPLPINGEVPDLTDSPKNSGQLRVGRKTKFRSAKRAVKAAAKAVGAKATILPDGQVKLEARAKRVATFDKDGKQIDEKWVVEDSEGKEKLSGSMATPTPKDGVKAVPNDWTMYPWYHGFGGFNTLGPTSDPQPEDTPAGLAALFAQAIFGAVAQTAPFGPTAAQVNDTLNAYQDAVWSEAEDVMVIMWNGIAPADAILANGMPGVWAGSVMEITKYVNYECIMDLNALDIGNMPPSPGTFGNASYGSTIAQAVKPTTGLIGQPKSSESWLSKIGGWIDTAVKAAPQVISAGSKAIDIAEAIGDFISAF